MQEKKINQKEEEEIIIIKNRGIVFVVVVVVVVVVLFCFVLFEPKKNKIRFNLFFLFFQFATKECFSFQIHLSYFRLSRASRSLLESDCSIDSMQAISNGCSTRFPLPLVESIKSCFFFFGTILSSLSPPPLSSSLLFFFDE